MTSALAIVTLLSPRFGGVWTMDIFTNAEVDWRKIDSSLLYSVSIERHLEYTSRWSAESSSRDGGVGKASRTSSSTSLPFLWNLSWNSFTKPSVDLTWVFSKSTGIEPEIGWEGGWEGGVEKRRKPGVSERDKKIEEER